MTEAGTAYTVTKADELVIADLNEDCSEVNKGSRVESSPGIQQSEARCCATFCATASAANSSKSDEINR